MTRPPAAALSLICASVGLVAVSTPLGALRAFNDQQRFRVETAAVIVNVSVRRGNTPVPGLAASDFELTDNGKTQTIDGVTFEGVPIDVSLVVDMSGSTLGNHQRFRNDVSEIAAMLRPSDRLSILSFGSMVSEVQTMQPSSIPPAVDRLVPSGITSVSSAVAAVLMRAPVAGRRHLVVVFTDGKDNNSVIRGSIVRDIARRSEAVLHLVFPNFGGDNRTLVGLLPVAREPEDVQDLLTECAQTTGGDSHHQGLFSRSLVPAFEDAFRQFRLSYVLTYRPTGVEPKGWHEIVVKVKSPDRLRIEAKRGYFGG